MLWSTNYRGSTSRAIGLNPEYTPSLSLDCEEEIFSIIFPFWHTESVSFIHIRSPQDSRKVPIYLIDRGGGGCEEHGPIYIFEQSRLKSFGTCKNDRPSKVLQCAQLRIHIVIIISSGNVREDELFLGDTLDSV